MLKIFACTCFVGMKRASEEEFWLTSFNFWIKMPLGYCKRTNRLGK